MNRVRHLAFPLALMGLLGCSKAPCRVASVTQAKANGHNTMTWTICPNVPLGVKVKCTDSAYDALWTNRPGTWLSGSHSVLWGRRGVVESPANWDSIAVTVGTETNGEYRWRFRATAQDRNKTGGVKDGGSGGIYRDKPQNVVFYDIVESGTAPIGSTLGRFVLSSQNGDCVTGEVSVVDAPK